MKSFLIFTVIASIAIVVTYYLTIEDVLEKDIMPVPKAHF